MNRGFPLFEEFFDVVFGTNVPAYQRFSQDDRDRTDELAKDLLPEWQDSDYANESEMSEKKREYVKLRKELKESKPFLLEIYKIVDGEFLPNLNIENGKVMYNFRQPLNFPDAQSWWDFLQTYNSPTISIVKNRSTQLWIWSFRGTSLFVEGSEAYIMTPEEMQNQIYLNMIGSDIDCYLSLAPIINFLGRNELWYRLNRSE